VNAVAILKEFNRRGVRLRVEAGRIVARPLSSVPPDLRKAAIEHKAELVERLLVDEALGLLNRLKCYTLPTGRIPAAREVAERCSARLFGREDDTSIDRSDNLAIVLAALSDIERELITLGSTLDPELLKTIAMVEKAFPGVRLVDIRRRLS
jgi:hypothetical protein